MDTHYTSDPPVVSSQELEYVQQSGLAMASRLRHNAIASHDDALAASSWLLGLGAFLDLSNHLLKCVGNVDVLSRRSLDEAALEALSELLTLLLTDSSGLALDVAFVANNHDRNSFGTLTCVSIQKHLSVPYIYQMIENLVIDDPHHVERLLRTDRVHKHVTVNPNEVLGIEQTILILLSISP